MLDEETYYYTATLYGYVDGQGASIWEAQVDSTEASYNTVKATVYLTNGESKPGSAPIGTVITNSDVNVVVVVVNRLVAEIEKIVISVE